MWYKSGSILKNGVNVIASSGFSIPSDYSDQFMRLLYSSEFISQALAEFECPNGNGGEIRDCKEDFTRFLVSMGTCRTRKAFDTVLQGSTFGPVYTTQWELPNCDVDSNGNPTKTCH